MQEKNEIKHFDYIDALRGLAILMVVVRHVGEMTLHSGLVLTITNLGAYGVSLFFMTSALTLFYSYSQRKNIDLSNTKINFFIRRFFRIAPEFYLAIIVYTVVLLFNSHIHYTGKYGAFSVLNTIIYSAFLGLLYQPAWTYLPFGGWTVQVEMIFYALIPFLFIKITTLKRSILLFFLTTIGYMFLNQISSIFGKYNELISFYLILPSQLPMFFLGIILYFILIKQKTFQSGYFLWSIYLYTVIAICMRYSWLPELYLVSIGLAGIIFSMAVRPIPLLVNSVTKFYGKISYSLYLSHFLIVMLVWYLYKYTDRYWQIDRLYAFFVSFAITLFFGTVISYFLYLYVETPGIRFGKKYIKR